MDGIRLQRAFHTVRKVAISELLKPPALDLPFSVSRYPAPVANTKRLYASKTSSINNQTAIPSSHIPLPDNAKTLTLSDGRKMGYAEYGSPTGHPFIFVHGTPDCRIDLTAEPKDEALMKRLNIRWIGIDRPGIGLSSFQPNRTILDWTKDLQHLVEHLKLVTYRILSVSGGTPYALACAKVMPREQLLSVGIMAGIGPREAGLKGTSLANRIGIQLWKGTPWLMESLYNRMLVPVMQNPDRSKAEDMFRKQMKYLGEEDRKVLSTEESIQVLTTIFKEVYRQGNARGAAWEMRLVTGDWGFEVGEVGFEGVRFWYGNKDVNTPVDGGRWTADRLKEAKFKVYEGKIHFSVWDWKEEILGDMLEDK